MLELIIYDFSKLCSLYQLNLSKINREQKLHEFVWLKIIRNKNNQRNQVFSKSSFISVLLQKHYELIELNLKLV